MKKTLLIGSLTLVLTATRASAAENFVQGFLNRYKPPLIDAPSAAGSQSAAQMIQTLMRDGTLALTVGDAVRLMLESNLDVRVDRFSPLTNQYLIESLFRPFEPTLRIGASMNRSTDPTISQLESGGATSSQLSHNYSVGFSQSFGTGTNIGVDFVVNRRSSNSVYSNFNPSYSGNLTYFVSQSLLRNRGRDVNMRAIRVAQNNKSISELQFELQLIELVTQAQMLYWDLVFAQEDIKVKQQSLALAEKTLADNQRQVQIGTLAPIEVLQAEAELAARGEQMVVTSYSSDQTQDRMKRMISDLGDPALVLARLNPVESIRRPSPTDVMPIEAAIQYALESRPEMRQLELELKNRDINLNYTRNQLLPTFDVFGNYTQRGIGGVERIAADTPTVQRGGVLNAFEQIFGYDFTGYSIGFSLSIPLSNKSAQAEYSRVLTEKQLTDARRANQAQAIALEVRNTHSQVEMNRARILAAEKSVQLARQQLAAEEKKNQLGVSPIRFVLDEQRSLIAAQTSEIQALTNYTKALVQYDRAVGRTLERNSILIGNEIQVVRAPEPETGQRVPKTNTAGTDMIYWKTGSRIGASN
jgi:outer membrane protein TolC